MLFKVKDLKEYLKNGYKVLPINIDIGICDDERNIFIKPMPIWFQIRYSNKGSKLDLNSKYRFGKALHEEYSILLQNCKIIANKNTSVIVIKPLSIYYQLYYIATFGYLRQKIILDEDYTLLHKFIDYLYSKKNKN